MHGVTAVRNWLAWFTSDRVAVGCMLAEFFSALSRKLVKKFKSMTTTYLHKSFSKSSSSSMFCAYVIAPGTNLHSHPARDSCFVDKIARAIVCNARELPFYLLKILTRVTKHDTA